MTENPATEADKQIGHGGNPTIGARHHGVSEKPNIINPSPKNAKVEFFITVPLLSIFLPLFIDKNFFNGQIEIRCNFKGQKNGRIVSSVF